MANQVTHPPPLPSKYNIKGEHHINYTYHLYIHKYQHIDILIGKTND